MATPTPAPDLSPDELSELLTAYMPDIPGYRVLRRLGQGGMSYVYLGVQESLDRQVAIKVIAPTALKDEISKLRFEREARTIAKLQHPAIVSIHDVGRSELGLLYYVMPFLPRGHLGQRDLRQDEPRLIAILRALLWGLDYAHERGVVHRDIKSENVLFDNVDRPLLTDFGIAMHRADRHRVTDGGFALGSATHMAPEQARGEKVDGRADLYSIGVIAYEKLTGDLPFQAEGPLQMAVRHSVDPIPRLPPSTAHWQAFIDRALAKTPEGRFASAQEMMAALDRIEQTRAARASLAFPERDLPVNALPPAPLPASSRQGVNPLFVAAAAVVVLVLALVVAWQAWDQRGGAAAPSGASAVLQEGVERPVAADAAPALDAVAATSPVRTDPLPPAPEPAIESAGGVLPADLSPPVEAQAEQGEDTDTTDLPPLQQALRSAELQIRQHRLTQPPGGNAYESLLRARSLGADARELTRLGEAWLAAAQPHVQKSFSAGVPTPDRRLQAAAVQLVQDLSLADSEAWQALQQAPRDWLRAQLRAALDAGDLDALRAARAEAQELSLKPDALEPEWSGSIVRGRVGQRLAGAPAQLLLRLPQGDRPGLAAMVDPVSRADYARFVAATGRAAVNCRIRSAAFNLRKRRWDAPGFDQTGAAPVVCISLDDAAAYAHWLGQQDGRAYRLPQEAEWRALPAFSAAEACRAQPAGCARPDQVREWSAPCADGCARQTLLGFGRREAEQPERERESAVDPTLGYDDVGFRLLRELPRAELELR